MNFKSCSLLGWVLLLGFGMLLCGHGVTAREEAKRTKMEDSMQIESVVRRSSSSAWVLAEEMSSCEEPYGFMPCSTKLGGNAALLLMYSYAFLKAAQLLTEGSELLLTVMSPGIIGGLVLPILGAFPDALLIAASGLGAATQAAAQEQVLVGMGLVAGSTVMVLTALWGSCLIVGRCDLELRLRSNKLVAMDRTLTKGFHLSETGVTTIHETKWAAWIMMGTLSPYIIAQAPRVLGLRTAGNLCILIAAVIAIASLIGYCLYQLLSPWIQENRIYWALHRYRRTHALHRLALLTQQQKWGSIFGPDGKPNKDVLLRLFDHFDPNNDGMLTEQELKNLIVGLGIERHNGQLPGEEEVAHWMREFDTSNDKMISKDEFLHGIEQWINFTRSFKKRSPRSNLGNSAQPLIWDTEAQTAQSDLVSLLEDRVDDVEDEEREQNPSVSRIIGHAILFLIAGGAVAAFFADPLVGAISGFSETSGISPFFISFVVTPLATSSSEAISSLMFARRKRRRNISMSYCQIYGAVTMKNTMCLGIFLAIVYLRGLVWDFSAEVLVVFFATLIIGGIAAVHTTFPLWMAFIGLALYPISIGLVAFLDSVCGWH